MAITAELKKLVSQMPTASRSGMFVENMDKQKIDEATAAIAKGGKTNVIGLIELLSDPGSEENVKPHYALHCVLNHALVTRNESLRKELCEAVASQLNNKALHANNRVYLCQELQWAGRDEACAALGRVLHDPDVSDEAATALAAIGGERAAAQLRAAVEQAEGKPRLNLMDALASLAEPASAKTFTNALADNDREVRTAASLGLAKLGQPDSAEPLLKAADSAQGWERTQLTKSCLVLAEQLDANGKSNDAKSVYQHLAKTRKAENEQHIRDAAQLGLAAIG